MKKNLCIIFLSISTVIGCGKAQPKPDDPDLTAKIAGNWKVFYCQGSGLNTNVCTGSVSLTRLSATQLYGNFNLSSGSPFADTCTIKIANNDTLFICPGTSGYYRKGHIEMTLGDGGLDVRFKKE